MNNTFMNNFPLKVIELFGGHPGTYKLFYTDWIVIRHLEELALGRPTTLSEDEFQKLGNAREFFREKYNSVLADTILFMKFRTYVKYCTRFFYFVGSLP